MTKTNALTELASLTDILRQLNIDLTSSTIQAQIAGEDPIINSPHKLGLAGATTQLLMDILAGKIWQKQVGPQPLNLAISIEDGLHSLHETHFITQGGHHIDVGAENVAVNNLFECADGKWVMLEAGPPYAKLLNGYLKFFNCPNERDAIAAKVSAYDSEDLETQLNNLGLPCCRAFTTAEWLSSEQGQLLASKPVVEITKTSDSDPVPFNVDAKKPLSGIKVFDFTHVLAGPYGARSLAQYGADVLHVSSPVHEDTLAQHLGVDIGKRNTYLDLDLADDYQSAQDLIQDADVVMSSYRHGVNEKFKLFNQNSNKGRIEVEISAYGSDGPWKDRAGFDQNGQTVSGFAMTEGRGGKPQFSPVFYLNDLLTGHFATIGVLAALLKRSEEGGSYKVKVNLARTAMWVESLGLIDESQLANLPKTDITPLTNIETHPTMYGDLTYPGAFVAGSAPLKTNNNFLEPYGASLPQWR